MLKKIGAMVFICLLLASCAVPDGADGEGELFPSPPPPSTAPTITVPQNQATVEAFGLAYSAAATLNPLTTTSSLNLALASLIFESLFEEDGTFYLAKAVSGGGSAEWQVTIRDDRVFSDGTPLTSADVVYSLNLARQSAVFKTRMRDIISIRAVDEYTITIITSKPYGNIEPLLTAPIIRESEDARYPLGTGMYAFTDAGDQSFLSLSDEYDFETKKPGISHIELRDAPDADLLISGFETGAITAVSYDPLATDPVIFGGLYEEWMYNTSDMIYMGFNTLRPAVADAEIRHILAAAADRVNMAVVDMLGRAAASDDPTDIDGSSHKPKALNELSEQLVSLGYEDTDEDGIIEHIIGRTRVPFELRVLCAASNEFKLAIAERLCEDLRRFGIAVMLDTPSWEDYQKALRDGAFDICISETILPASGDLSALVRSGGELNMFGYANEDMDALLDACIAATKAESGAARLAIINKLKEDTPFAPLVFKMKSLLTRWGEVKNAEPSQGTLYGNIEAWR